MNIAQALKEKNRLLKKIKEVSADILSNNRYRTDDTTGRQDNNQLILEYTDLISNLSTLKQKIAIASGPIQKSIALIGLLTEYKTTITALNTSELPEVINSYSEAAKEVPVVVVVKQGTKKEMIDLTQKRIDALQDEIDNFNAVTQV